MKNTVELVAYKNCGKPTAMLGTKQCDGCWEERRSGKLDLAEARIRELEAENAHLKSMMRGQTFVTDMTAPETGAKPIERTEVCKHYATVENCPMCSPKSEGGKHGT